ncbi:Lpg1974 family pore-forming outer membrane protein [Simkania sp.]|uniref:Lpg1974 family pore-forming outer membrane protein n=1 Tax=Simkania sp. TaxID=34094 RepID=UPI003B51F433
MRKCVLFGIVFVTLGMGAAFADTHVSKLSLQDQTAEQKMEALSFYGEQTGNPTVYPNVKRWVDPFITAEFTYWQVLPRGVGYFRNGQRKAPNTTLSQGSISRIGYHWEPGFKLALGGILPHGGWDILTRYTYVNTTISDASSDFVQGGQPSFVVNPGNGQSADLRTPIRGKGYFHSRLNAMDLELGRKFFNHRFLALRFFTGIKGTWISMNDRFTYNADPNISNSDLTIDGNPVEGPVVIKNKSYTWGVGPRVGLEGNWYFIQCLSIFARFSMGPIYTNVDAHAKVTFYDGSNPSTTVINIKNNNVDAIETLSEIQLGLEGEWWLYNQTYKIAARVLYEVQQWGGGYTTVNGTQINTESISMHGLTTGLSFFF